MGNTREAKGQLNVPIACNMSVRKQLSHDAQAATQTGSWHSGESCPSTEDDPAPKRREKKERDRHSARREGQLTWKSLG